MVQLCVKPRLRRRIRREALVSGRSELDGERRGRLGGADFSEGVADDFLGEAGAFAALAGDSSGLADFPVTAAAFIDGFADLTVGNTLAEADIHIAGTVAVRLECQDTNVNENACQNACRGGRPWAMKGRPGSFVSPATHVLPAVDDAAEQLGGLLGVVAGRVGLTAIEVDVRALAGLGQYGLPIGEASEGSGIEA